MSIDECSGHALVTQARTLLSALESLVCERLGQEHAAGLELVHSIQGVQNLLDVALERIDEDLDRLELDEAAFLELHRRGIELPANVHVDGGVLRVGPPTNSNVIDLFEAIKRSIGPASRPADEEA